MAEVNNVYHEIKQKINCLYYARYVLGLPIKSAGDRCLGIGQVNSTNKGLVVYEDSWYDHYSKLYGDVISMAQHFKHGGDFGSAVRELSALACIEVNHKSIARWKENTQSLANYVGLCQKDLSEKHRKYMEDRGFNETTIKECKVGTTKQGNIIMPCLELSQNENYPVYYSEKVFDKDGHPGKYIHAPLSKTPSGRKVPWGYHSLDREDKPLIIAEGILDAMTCYQEGYRTLSPLGSGFSQALMPQMISTCKMVSKSGQKVIICFDNDTAGNSAARKLSMRLFMNRVEHYVCVLEKDGDDLNDYYIAGGKLKDIEACAKESFLYLSESITDKEDFKFLVKNASKFIDKADLSEFLENVAEQGNFSVAWLKEIKKECLKCPAERITVKNIMAKHDLMFNESLGYSKYSLGCYRFITDTEMDGIIAEELGLYDRGALYPSIKKAINSKIEVNDGLDAGDYFNFTNGMFNLKTGKLESHSPSFKSTIQLTYPYDRELDCQRWREFIYEIMEGDPKKEMLLQEMIGYILFNDCSLQKAFILIGEGSNGKGVLLDTVKKVFGKANTTSEEISELERAFNRIKLRGSYANICSEIKSNMNGAEQTLKKIVAGETINGEYKHKKSMDFEPRCKIICSTNTMIKSKDHSYGFQRRMCFVKFNLVFLEDPLPLTKPHHRRADTTLLQILEQELPGIFNWALTGYQLLKKKKCFTITDEQKYLLEDMRFAGNPNLMFFSEIEDASYTAQQLWDKYSEWSIITGMKPSLNKAEIYPLADLSMLKSYDPEGNAIYKKK